MLISNINSFMNWFWILKYFECIHNYSSLKSFNRKRSKFFVWICSRDVKQRQRIQKESLKNNEALSYQNNLFGCKYTYVILCLYNSLCLLSLCKNSFYKKDTTIPIVCLGVFFNLPDGIICQKITISSCCQFCTYCHSVNKKITRL